MNKSLASLGDENRVRANELASLRTRTSALEAELQAAKENILALRHKPLPSHEASMSLVAIGIEWTDAPSDPSYLWFGTGFGIAGTNWFATAAHVIQQAHREQSSLEKRGVPSRVVLRYSDSTIASLIDSKLHPQFHLTNRNTDEPSCDVAVFLSKPQRPTMRLAFSDEDAPRIGDEVFVAGFPQSIPQIRYPSGSDAPFLPTVRCGRIERLIDIDDLSRAKHRNLLQLDIPIVGGFSGSPVIDMNGKVVGVAVFSTHHHIIIREAGGAGPSLSDTKRVLDAAHVSFAVGVTMLKQLVNDTRLSEVRR